MQSPMTSCGCFECVACVLPGTGGIMIVDRDYQGMTPVGMTFSSLAEITGGGQQTPGFIGIGTLYILSKKFISADGGLQRVVWTTTRIKERLGERLQQRCDEIGQPDLLRQDRRRDGLHRARAAHRAPGGRRAPGARPGRDDVGHLRTHGAQSQTEDLARRRARGDARRRQSRNPSRWVAARVSRCTPSRRPSRGGLCWPWR